MAFRGYYGPPPPPPMLTDDDGTRWRLDRDPETGAVVAVQVEPDPPVEPVVPAPDLLDPI